jgi:lipopolysaccharide exporter
VTPPARAQPEAAALANTTLRGAVWVGASRVGGRVLFFLSTLLLARLLSPEDFGVAGYAVTLIVLLGSLPDLGLGPALIHHRDDRETLDTGFWLGIAAGLGAFALVWVAAPLSSWFFGDDRAVSVTRVLALTFPLESLRNVHATLLRKNLDFRKRFVPDTVQSLAKGLVAIAMAIAGFGYWSLTWGTVGATALAIPVYWIASGWRPGLHVSTAAARRLLPFGAHVVAVDMLGAFVRNVDYLFVGRLLGAATLGIYTLAFRIPDLLVRELCLTLGQVLLPVYARLREDVAAIHATFLATMTYVTAITAPMAIGLALVAEPFVVTAFGERWRPVAAVIPSICCYALFISLTHNIGDLYKALGRPDLLTRLSLLRIVVGVPAIGLAAAVAGSAAAVGWAQAGTAVVGALANFAVAGGVFRLPVRDALARTLPIVAACACMAVVVLAVRSAVAGQAPLVQLAVTAGAGAATYAGMLRLLAREFWNDGLRAVLGAGSRRRVAQGVTP